MAITTAYKDVFDVVALPNRSRRRKTRIALLIRCACVLVFMLFCFIASPLQQQPQPQHHEADNVNLFARGHPLHYTLKHRGVGGVRGRKLLAVQQLLVGQQEHEQQQNASSTMITNTTELPHDIITNSSSSSTVVVPEDAAVVGGNVSTANCTKAAIHEFPPDGFTRAQRQHGWFMLHIAVSCYCFWLLAIVCDDYFVPVMESLCSSKQ